MDDDSWDAIDWDQKISDERQHENEMKSTKIDIEENDGNYYEINQAKKSQGGAKKMTSKNISKSNVKYVLPYSYKELKEISCENDFYKVIYRTFGDFERYLMTHEEQLSDESLVEIIKIDMMLLQVPFTYHNKLLITRVLKIESFWQQVIAFIRAFYEKNCKDPRYMLLIDTKGFFKNIESLLCWILLHNYNHCGIINEIISTIESFSEDESLKLRLNDLKSLMNLSDDVCNYEIFPKLSDFKASPEKLEKNIIKGEYLNVFHYLNIQLPLIKEDFLCKLRSGFDHLKNSDIIKYERTHDAIIIPNVRIEIIWQKVWNINCPLMIANLSSSVHEIFNGQLVCFTSKKNDLIVATVLRNSQLELLIPKNSIIIEIISVENVEDILNQAFIMVEAKAFFDPYAQVFQSLKSLHEHNFPFKGRFLKLHKEPKNPRYDQQEYCFKNYTVDLFSDLEKFKFGLEVMQLKALKESVQNDFTLIVGPPGTGKSFIGIEIVKIFLENTNEKILVLTQTNNALDKFLIGCMKSTDKIARFGAQCKEKELSNFIVKRNIPHESKIYLKKLQASQRDIVASLIDENAEAKDIFKEISFHYRLVEEVNQLDTFHTVNDKRIFGMTTSYAAHNSTLMKMLNAGIVIIEEASEILESHVLAAITKDTKQIIMIGDHHQLRPQTNSFELQKKFNFNISLYERLIKNEFPHITLDVQMRMRPEFCDLVRNTIYDDLKDGENVKNYKDVTGMTRNFFFLNHDHPEGSSDTSKENLFEIDFIINLYKKLLTVGSTTEDIVILTPYIAQAKRFSEKIKKLNMPKARVAVLDSYQGEESNIILLSLVRSNKNNEIGFLSLNNRICVLLTRAKMGFYICGNIECLSRASKTWRDVKAILIKHNALGNELPSDLAIARNRLTSKN